MSQAKVGAVAIGRNEGERLILCLEALLASGMEVVYVDSNSSDNSVAEAKARGVHVVELDLSKPFTAARARNAGAQKLLEVSPDSEFLQFVDGDCELEAGWVATALAAFADEPELVAACGRRKERFPSATPFNQLCDLEWDTPIGLADACGGDALYRRSAFEAVSGFDETLIAGEEPELCYRLREAGGKIRRLDAPMTLHDADVHRFGQWWKRTVRSGHAAAEAWALHGSDGQTAMVRIAKSALAYGLVAPLTGLIGFGVLLALGLGKWSLIAPLATLVLFSLLISRVRATRLELGDSPETASLYARYTFLGKFAEMTGVLKFALGRLRGRRSTLIEYK